MDFNIETRKKQLENLDQVIASSKSRIQSVLDYLGWTESKVKKEDPLVYCPINPTHRLLPKSWQGHVEKCMIQAHGYDPKGQFLSESTQDPKRTIFLDHSKKIEIIRQEIIEKGAIRLAWNGMDPDPMTSDRWISTYSPDERLAFYNYCAQNTASPPAPPEFTTVLPPPKPRGDRDEDSYEQTLRIERDAKRRRAKYRSVHLNKKNYTEVMREVINGQMDEYKDWVVSLAQSKEEGPKNGTTPPISERPHSSISHHSTHSGSSRSTSKRDNLSRRRSRHRSRSRDRDRYKNYRDRPRSPRNNRSNNHRRTSSVDRKKQQDRRRRSKSKEKQTSRKETSSK